MDGKEIRARYDRLKQLRQTVNETWDQIERFIAPYRGRFFKDERSENSIEWRKPWIYDSTAIMAAQSLASHIHSSLTSPKVKWFDLKYREPELNENQEAVAWLDEVSEIMFKTLHDSNFTVQASETYQDLVDFGTSIIIEEAESEEEWRGLNFLSVPVKEGYFEQDHKGRIVNFYYVHEWSAVQIIEKFGYDNVPEWVREQADDPNKAEVREVVIQAVYKRQEIDETKVDKYAPLSAEKRPYGFKYILHKDCEELGNGGGYYEMPAFCPRWRKTSSSMWGNSPAMVALADVMTLNRLVELQIQAMEKVLDPPTLTTERGLMSDLDLNAGGITVVRSLDQIKPYESGARFDINYQEIMRYRDQIREYFMIDQLVLPPMEGTPATATEIAARVSQLERLIGPTLGRLQSDFLDPLISRTFNILMRAGLFPEVPEIVAQTPTGMDVEYVGALARSQEQDQVTATDRWLMTLMNLAQVDPTVMDIPDMDAAMKGVGHKLGVPAKFMKSDSEIKKIRNQREQMQKKMMQAEAAQAEGDAMKSLGEGRDALNGQGAPAQ